MDKQYKKSNIPEGCICVWDNEGTPLTKTTTTKIGNIVTKTNEYENGFREVLTYDETLAVRIYNE